MEFKVLSGRFVELVPLTRGNKSGFVEDLTKAFKDDDKVFTYLSIGPAHRCEDVDQMLDFYIEQMDAGVLLCYVILNAVTKVPVGWITYLRIRPDHKSIEIGWVTFSSLMQRTCMGTETIYLLLEHAFASGFHRMEWKCDALNDKSRKAARRYGFQCEGVWGKSVMYKGRSRDTLWLSILEPEWTTNLQNGFKRWLDPGNFDENGKQINNLEHFYSNHSPTELPELPDHVMNEFGQPVGLPVSRDSPFPELGDTPLQSNSLTLKPVEGEPTYEIFVDSQSSGDTIQFQNINRTFGICEVEFRPSYAQFLDLLNSLYDEAASKKYRRVAVVVPEKYVDAFDAHLNESGFQHECTFRDGFVIDKVPTTARFYAKFP